MKTEIENQAKHTAGEWYQMSFGKDEATGLSGVTVYGPDALRICETLFSPRRTAEEHQANVNVITAAPDAIAALQYIVGWRAKGWNADTARNMALAALKKAGVAK